MRTPTRLATVLIVAAAGACSGAEREATPDTARQAAAPVAVEQLPAGDSVGITNRTGAVLLSVARDSVSMGFSPATLEKIRKETDTTGAGSGFGAMIERKVKSGVQSLLSTRVMVPVDNIESVRYEDGAIQFTYRSRPRGMKLEDIKIDKEPALASFREEDARAFVKAVEARLVQR